MLQPTDLETIWEYRLAVYHWPREPGLHDLAVRVVVPPMSQLARALMFFRWPCWRPNATQRPRSHAGNSGNQKPKPISQANHQQLTVTSHVKSINFFTFLCYLFLHFVFTFLLLLNIFVQVPSGGWRWPAPPCLRKASLAGSGPPEGIERESGVKHVWFVCDNYMTTVWQLSTFRKSTFNNCQPWSTSINRQLSSFWGENGMSSEECKVSEEQFRHTINMLRLVWQKMSLRKPCATLPLGHWEYKRCCCCYCSRCCFGWLRLWLCCCCCCCCCCSCCFVVLLFLLRRLLGLPEKSCDDCTWPGPTHIIYVLRFLAAALEVDLCTLPAAAPSSPTPPPPPPPRTAQSARKSRDRHCLSMLHDVATHGCTMKFLHQALVGSIYRCIYI